ncbi:MAG TPA: FtsX-like permease family protein [Blastocatellia bacterium]|nr:FtsX-like permease family protein [Blastocatellia bacterium]
MLRTLIFIAFREWRRHKVRAAITVVSVAVGVSAYFAMMTTNQSLFASLESTVDKLAGKATLQVTAADSGFAESALETVRTAPGVKAATAIVQQFCWTGIKDKSGPRGALNDRIHLLVLGVDPENEMLVRADSYGSTPLAGPFVSFFRFPGVIAISSKFAEQQGLRVGDSFSVITPKGERQLSVIYVFSGDGIGALYGGNVGVMDIKSAQDVFGREGKVDRIDIVTASGVEIESVGEFLRQHLPSGLEVQRPRQRSQEVEDGTLMMRQGFLLTSLFALLIGAFLIYNAMAISVSQRWRQIGILRSLGATGRDIRAMFLCEAVLIGVSGSLLGVLLGFSMAVQFSRITGSLSNYLSSSIVDLIVPEPPRFNAILLLESVALGVFASVVSAWLPARSASRLDPAQSLQNVENRRRVGLARPWLCVLGALLVVAGFALVRFSTGHVGGMVQLVYMGVVFVGFLAMLPTQSRVIASALRPTMNRIFGSEGVLAVDSIIASPGRTAATVGAMMAGLAFVYATWSTIQTSKQTLVSSFLQQSSYDLQAWTPSSMSEEDAARIGAIPGVKDADKLQNGTTRYHGQVAGFFSSDMYLWFSHPENKLVEGDVVRARALVPRGQGILISKNFAARWGLHLGDVLSLETPTRRLERPVLGIVDYMGWFEGTIYLDRSLYSKYWLDDKFTALGIDLQPGANPETVRKSVESTFQDGRLAFVLTADQLNRRVRDVVSSSVDRLFSFFYVQMFIAAFVGMIGIINTLVISVWDRKREIGILRAVGGTRLQIARMVLIEAAVLGVIGLVTGAAKGIFDTYFMSRTAATVFVGYTLPFYFPGYIIALSVPVVIILAIAAAWWPARIAARTNVVSAIASE